MPGANLFPQTVNIVSVGITTTAQGNAQTTTTLYKNLPCRIRTSSPSFLIFDDGRKVQVAHSISTNQIVNVQPGNLVLYGSRTFKVQYTRNLMESNQVFIIMCYEYLDQVG